MISGIGVFAKEFAAAPLWIVLTIVAALERNWRLASRLLAAAVAGSLIWVFMQLGLRVMLNYTNGATASSNLLHGAYLALWLRNVGAVNALKYLFTHVRCALPAAAGWARERSHEPAPDAGISCRLSRRSCTSSSLNARSGIFTSSSSRSLSGCCRNCRSGRCGCLPAAFGVAQSAIRRAAAAEDDGKGGAGCIGCDRMWGRGGVVVERIGTTAHSAGAGTAMTISRGGRVAKRGASVVVSVLLALEGQDQHSADDGLVGDGDLERDA